MFEVYNPSENHKLPLDLKVFKFPGGEMHFKMEQPLMILNGLTIKTDLRNSDEIMLMVLVTDAYRHVPLYLELLYTPYARQDRRTAHNEPFSLRAFAKIINMCGFKRVTVYDPHSDVTPALIDNIYVVKRLELVQRLPGLVEILKTPGTVIVSPDAGAMKTNNEIAAHYKLPHVNATKVRDTATGEISGTQLHATFMDMPEHFVVLDDICDGGKTFIELAKVLNTYNTKRSLYVTVGLFSKGIEVLEECYDNVFYTYRPGDENIT